MSAAVIVQEGVDYCTGWPDQIWGMDLRYCCARHDLFYAANADNLNWLDFVGAHWELAQCVGGVMGATMFAGLCTFGLLSWIHFKNRLSHGARDRKKD